MKRYIFLLLTFFSAILLHGQNLNERDKELKQSFKARASYSRQTTGSLVGKAHSVMTDSLPDHVLQRISQFQDQIKLVDSNTVDTGLRILNFVRESLLKTEPNDSRSFASDWVLQQEPIVVLPSANASSFINRANASVSKYTGALNYEIPIFDLKSYSISLPISLSYYTTGAKVDEIASWVGLGWTLNAGGCISRVMNGLPDEFEGNIITVYDISLPAYGYLTLKDHPDYQADPIDIEGFPPDDLLMQKRYARNANWENLSGYSDNDLGQGEAWDTRPDEFYYSFPGYSGKFVFDQDGNILTIPHNNLKIEKTIKTFVQGDESQDKIVEFVVYTPDGYVYTFGDMNMESVETTSTRRVIDKYGYEYNKVIFANGDATLPVTNTEGIDIDSYCYTRYGVDLKFNELDEDKVDHDLLDIECSSYNSSWYLKSITSPDEDYINFNYSENDCPIVIKSKRGQSVVFPNLSDEKFISIYGEVYYFLCTPEEANMAGRHKQEVSFFQNFETYELKYLSSINTKSGNTVDFITSQEYREDYLMTRRLKYMKLYDYNNRLDKTYEFDYYYSSPTDYVGKDVFYLGTDPSNAGGSIELNEYDNHFWDLDLIAEQKRMFLSYLHEYNNEGAEVMTPYHFLYYPGVLPRRGGYKADKYGYNFNNNVGTNLRRVSYTDPYGRDFPTYPDLSRKYFRFFNTTYGGWPGDMETANSCESCAKVGVLNKVITPETGAIEFEFEGNSKRDIGNSTYGLRVKSIKRYPDLMDTENFVKESYEYFNGAFRHDGLKARYQVPTWYNTEKYALVHSLPNYVYSNIYTHGGVLGYGKVRVSDGSGGYTEYEFNNPTTIHDDQSLVYACYNGGDNEYDVYPFPPYTDFDWKRGTINANRICFSDENEAFKEIYNFDFNPSNYVSKSAYGLIGGSISYDNEFQANFIDVYRAGKYEINSGWFNVSNVETRHYSSEYPGDDSKAIVDSKDNIYEVKSIENKQYTFLKQVNTTSSNGEEITNKFTYPLDIVNPNDVFTTQDVIDGLIDNQMINYQLKNEYFLDNDLVDGAIIGYDFKINNEIIKPAATYLLEGSTYQVKSHFDNYNAANGQLSRIHNENNIYNSYLWGYNNQYPIVKAENISSVSLLENTVHNLVPDMETFLNNLGDLTTATARSDWENFNTNLRNSFPDAMISTYTYVPLVGMTSETDPNNSTVYYYYDSRNRLETIKDNFGKTVQHFDYNYTLSAEVTGKKSYYHLGEFLNLNADFYGGSGNLTNQWTIYKNSSVFASGTDNSLQTQLTDIGSYQYLLDVNDNETGYSIQKTGYFPVSSMALNFINIEESTNGNEMKIEADINAPWNDNITLHYFCMATSQINEVHILIEGVDPIVFYPTQYYSGDIIVPITETNPHCTMKVLGPDYTYIYLDIISAENCNISPSSPKMLVISHP